MQSKICKQTQNSEQNIEIKYPKGDILFVGGRKYLLEFSLTENKTVYYFAKILKDDIVSMAKTLDKKSQFVCGYHGKFKELNISACKLVNSFPVQSAINCVVTYDNKFLITASSQENCILTKWSIRAKKQLDIWQSGVGEQVSSQTCSYNNKYQLIGYCSGWLGIFHLQKHQTLKNIQVMSSRIVSVIFSRDNQSAFIGDAHGCIKQIKWQPNANSEDEFDFAEELKKVGDYGTKSICLTKDEKYLLIGSKALVIVFETLTRKKKEIKLTDIVVEITLIKDGKKAIIAEINGNLSIIDLETLEISSIAKNIANDKMLHKITVI